MYSNTSKQPVASSSGNANGDDVVSPEIFRPASLACWAWGFAPGTFDPAQLILV